jgi:hypothetical protein
VEPYLDAAKQLYKDTVSVVKDPAENKLVVTSSVYKGESCDIAIGNQNDKNDTTSP